MVLIPHVPHHIAYSQTGNVTNYLRNQNSVVPNLIFEEKLQNKVWDSSLNCLSIKIHGVLDDMQAP